MSAKTEARAELAHDGFSILAAVGILLTAVAGLGMAAAAVALNRVRKAAWSAVPPLRLTEPEWSAERTDSDGPPAAELRPPLRTVGDVTPLSGHLDRPPVARTL